MGLGVLRVIQAHRLPEDLRRAKAEAVRRFGHLKAAEFNPEADNAGDELQRVAGKSDDGSGAFFQFHEGLELNNAHAGLRGDSGALGRKRAYFLECRVGGARMGDRRPAGSRRLVLQIDSLRIVNIYFTDDHYEPGSWYELSVNG
jgi:hypothetical protein